MLDLTVTRAALWRSIVFILYKRVSKRTNSANLEPPAEPLRSITTSAVIRALFLFWRRRRWEIRCSERRQSTSLFDGPAHLRANRPRRTRRGDLNGEKAQLGRQPSKGTDGWEAAAEPASGPDDGRTELRHCGGGFRPPRWARSRVPYRDLVASSPMLVTPELLVGFLLLRSRVTGIVLRLVEWLSI